MDFKDISLITLRLIDKIDNQWRLFFLSNIGVAVWVLSNPTKINFTLALILSFGFLAYSYVQYFAAIRAYLFLSQSIEELKVSIDNNGITIPSLKNNILKLKYSRRFSVVTVSYLLIVPIVLIVIWKDFI